MKKFISFICAVSLIVVCVISLFTCEFSTYSGVMNAEINEERYQTYSLL